MTLIFDPARHCGGKTRPSDGPPGPCRLTKGHRTDHPGAGNCRFHGGNTPNGKKYAATELAERAIARLGVPRGNGDPFVLLAAAVQHAQGHLEAAAQLVRTSDQAEADDKVSAARVDLAAAVEIYEQAIRTASRTGKAAVDADVADRLAALDERAAGLLMRFVIELLERFVPKPRRPEGEAWASLRLAELAEAYERPGALN